MLPGAPPFLSPQMSKIKTQFHRVPGSNLTASTVTSKYGPCEIGTTQGMPVEVLSLNHTGDCPLVGVVWWQTSSNDEGELREGLNNSKRKVDGLWPSHVE